MQNEVIKLNHNAVNLISLFNQVSSLYNSTFLYSSTHKPGKEDVENFKID